MEVPPVEEERPGRDCPVRYLNTSIRYREEGAATALESFQWSSWVAWLVLIPPIHIACWRHARRMQSRRLILSGTGNGPGYFLGWEHHLPSAHMAMALSWPWEQYPGNICTELVGMACFYFHSGHFPL